MGSKTPPQQVTTQTTEQKLSPQQTELLDMAMPQLRNFAANPPQLYPGSTVAPFDPAQTAGQEQALQAAGGYSNALTNAQNAYTGAAGAYGGVNDAYAGAQNAFGGTQNAYTGAQGAYNAAAPAYTGVSNAYNAAAQNLAPIAGQAAGTYGRLTSGEMLSPDSNPYLKQYMEAATTAATRPIVDDLLERALPAVRGGSVMTGYGGSRQGIAEGLAAGKAAQTIGETGRAINTEIANKGYQTGVDAMIRGLGLTPTVTGAQTAGADATARGAEALRTGADVVKAGADASRLSSEAALAGAGAARTGADALRTGAEAMKSGAQLAGEQITPALWTSGVGDVRQNLAQQLLGEDAARFNYQQQLPLAVGRELASIAAGTPGGGSQTVAIGPAAPQKNALLGGLGGASTGAALGNLLFPGLGAIPGALIGGGIGAFA